MPLYTCDDMALALSNLVDQATDDIPFVKGERDGYETAYKQAALRQRSRLTALARLIGTPLDGDQTMGDDTNAESIVRELEIYEADPVAYIDKMTQQAAPLSDSADDAHTPAPTPAALSPAPALAQPIATAPVTLTPALSFVELPAHSIFPGISPTYASEFVPIAKWHGQAPKLPQPDAHYRFDGMAVKITAAAMRKRRNLMITGDPGVGKTEFFRQFGIAVGLPVHKIPFDGSLTRSDLIGSFRQVATPNGSETPFVDGLIPRLIQQPGIIVLDEINQADPDIQYMMHPVYEGEGLTIMEDGGRFVPRHPSCFIVGTANDKGRGSENGLTHSKFEMSEATRDRFSYWLEFNYMSADHEAATISAKSGITSNAAKSLVSIGTMIRDGYRSGTLAQPCSLRQLLDVADLVSETNTLGHDIDIAVACDVVLCGRANTDDKIAIRNFIRTEIGVDLETLDLS